MSLLFILFQLERNVHFPPVALGDLVDVAERDVILLEPELDGVANDVQLLRQRLVGDVLPTYRAALRISGFLIALLFHSTSF